MADDRQSTSAAGGARGYKRSWKNLLINKRYQLRFTLFMVIVSTLLMAGLGWWVLDVADEATRVQGTEVRSDNCKELPKLGAFQMDGAQQGAVAPAAGSAAASGSDDLDADDDDDATPVEPDKPAAGSGSASAVPVPAPAPEAAPEAAKPKPDGKPDNSNKKKAAPLGESGDDCSDTAPCATNLECRDGACHHRVSIGTTSMTINPIPDHFADDIAEHYECEMRQGSRLDDLEAGRRHILWFLIASGLVMVVGLAIYGIKMTHKVAGPLYKITLYMGKMRDGRYDKVYNLRKGDQLVDFYEHFKTAHAGVVDLEKADIAQLQALIASSAELEGKSPEVDAAIAELRTILARKEKSLE
jgi:hypothetical protein